MPPTADQQDAAAPAPDADGARSEDRARRRRQLGRLSITGAALATAAAWWSASPSLVPRPWIIQALLTGLTLIIIYGLGALAGWLYRALRLPDVPSGGRRWILRVLAVALPIGLLIAGWLGRDAQSSQRALLGMDAGVPVLWIVGPLLGVPIAVLILAISRGVKWIGRRLSTGLGRRLPGRTGFVLGIALTVYLTYGVFTGLFNAGVVGQMDRIFAGKNDQTDQGVYNPRTRYASGGSTSSIRWDDLGRQGRQFVWQRRTESEIRDVTRASDAQEPIRAYVGLKVDDDDAVRAERAVEELRRLGAFEKDAIAVGGATGSGWISPRTAAALEFVTHGHVATVVVQYSYLPSWLSFLVDAERARSASNEMITALRVALNEMPADERPALYVFGESLGTNATDSAFTNVEDLSTTTDGALLVGPPGFDENFRQIQERREGGSPAWQPLYKGGSIVQVAGTGTDLRDDRWTTPNRVVYLVHATDPIVVWQGYDRRAWLAPRGPGVPGSVRHVPIVGNIQAGIDVFGANNVPAGYGHIYDDTVVDAWSEIHGPPPLPVGELDRIKAAVRPIDDPK